MKKILILGQLIVLSFSLSSYAETTSQSKIASSSKKETRGKNRVIKKRNSIRQSAPEEVYTPSAPNIHLLSDSQRMPSLKAPDSNRRRVGAGLSADVRAAQLQNQFGHTTAAPTSPTGPRVGAELSADQRAVQLQKALAPPPLPTDCDIGKGKRGYFHTVTVNDLQHAKEGIASRRSVGSVECWDTPPLSFNNKPSKNSQPDVTPKGPVTPSNANHTVELVERVDGREVGRVTRSGTLANVDPREATTPGAPDAPPAATYQASTKDYRNVVGEKTKNLYGKDGLMAKAEKTAGDAADRQTDLDNVRSDFKNTKPKLFGRPETKGDLTADRSEASLETPKHLSRKDYKFAKTQAKQERNKAQDKADKAADASDHTASQDEIRRVNQSQGYGGNYGGASTERTQKINETVKVMSAMTEQKVGNVMQRRNTEAQYNYMSKGMDATQQDEKDTEAKNIDNAISATNTMGLTTAMMGAFQGFRATQHLNSVKNVRQSASYGRTATDQDEEEALKAINADPHFDCGVQEPYKSLCEKDKETKIREVTEKANAQRANVAKNFRGEKDAQGNAAINQTLEAAQTMTKAYGMYANAESLKVTADRLRRPSGGGNNNFMFNPGSGTRTTPDGSAGGPHDTPGGTTDEKDTKDEVADKGNDPINLGNGDPGIANDKLNGAFGPAGPAAAGGPGGGGLGSSGGTAAAKDDGSAKGGEAPGKQQGGGGYASDGPGGSGYKGSGGHGGAVGMDNSFADLLKKFLPGGEEDKKKQDGAMAFDDRSPASDQAAVIGRNKNIFEEIHKRYQKKSGEGAIVF